MKEIKKLRINIRNERKRQNLSRNQLAKKAHISPYTLVDLELGRGSNDVKLSTLLKISEGLEVSLPSLLK
ncbi:helix-turn-helix transcriptional regulator [Candidatus Dojkabacteria bacterium]|nr:helix-turn-helix transcriptional regulator [Candidatus Dojkabacteria bacterium]